MFRGCIVALVTPMKANGEIDFEALAKLVEMHIANGTNAIVVIGTTGESPTLDAEEQKAVVAFVVRQAANRIPVIAGTGANATLKAIELTRNAMEVGADACLIVTPYYNKPTQEGLYQHYKAIANAVPIPQILYNVPGRTGCDLLTETVERLSEIPNIIAIKEGNPERTLEIIQRCGEKIDVFSGDDITALEIILQGGKGVISVTANVAPKMMHEFCEAALSGDTVRANALNQNLTLLHKNLFLESNPIPVKWVMHEMGLIPEGIRLPLTKLAERYHDAIREAMKQAGIW